MVKISHADCIKKKKKEKINDQYDQHDHIDYDCCTHMCVVGNVAEAIKPTAHYSYCG